MTALLVPAGRRTRRPAHKTEKHVLSLGLLSRKRKRGYVNANNLLARLLCTYVQGNAITYISGPVHKYPGPLPRTFASLLDFEREREQGSEAAE